MATAEKGRPAPAPEPERKFPLTPLVGAVAAIVAQKFVQWDGVGFNRERPDIHMWLYWVAGALMLIAGLFHFAPRKNGKVVQTPFNLDVLGPLGVLGFTAITAYYWVKDDNTASTVTLSLSLGAFAVIAWGYYLAAQKRGRDFQLLRDRLLLAIGVSAGLGYANFGHLHFNNFIHTWDTYHYYVGAKYFPEVGYDRMYECAITADAEDFPAAKLEKMREQRIVTNLRTNIMEKVGETVLLRPNECKSHFTNERWLEFKKDIAFFRARVNDKRWEEIHHDHGYNASPVWTLLGYVITNTGTATLDQVTFVDLFDPFYLALMAALIYWAFGPRVFAVALIMLGTNWASRFFYWTGGALLRHDWLFYTVAVICLAKKGKPLMAGVALAYATLLRLFPGLLLVGPILAALEYARVRWKTHGDVPAEPEEVASTEGQEFFWKKYAAMTPTQQSSAQRSLLIMLGGPAMLVFYLFTKDAQLGRVTALLLAGAVALVAVLHTLEVVFARLLKKGPRLVSPVIARFAIGGILATVLLCGASLRAFGGIETWQKFAANTSKHAATPLTNHMGMRTVFSTLPWTAGKHLRDSKVLDAWQPWKDKRVEVFKVSRYPFMLAALAGLVLLYFAVRGAKGLLWASAAMGAGFIVVGAELTNYYYVFFVAMAALHELRREVGMWLCAMVATCIFMMLTPFGGMSSWQDEQSVAMSIVSLIAVAGVWWTFTPWAKKYVVEPEPEPVLLDEPRGALAPATAAGSSSGGGGGGGGGGSGGKKKKR